jgi:hypothetical protein
MSHPCYPSHEGLLTEAKVAKPGQQGDGVQNHVLWLGKGKRSQSVC